MDLVLFLHHFRFFYPFFSTNIQNKTKMYNIFLDTGATNNKQREEEKIQEKERD